MTIGIFGAGFSGKAIGQALAQSGTDVWGTTRSQENFAALKERSITPYIFDGQINAALLAALKTTTHLVISIAPPREENPDDVDAPVDPVLVALESYDLSDILPSLSWVGYLSTVGVYGNHDGNWIDESEPASPLSARSRQRVRAEAEWLTLGEASDIPVGIFRLSGIYGPGRNALVTASSGKSRRLVKKNQVFNRIHNGDIAQAIVLASKQKISGIFNITDDEPAPPQDVVACAHQIIGRSPPPEIDFETADLSPMARSFYGENKRVSNAKSKDVLGLRYQWPNYRDALTRMWKEDNWRA